MKKRILAIVLALALIAALIPVPVGANAATRVVPSVFPYDMGAGDYMPAYGGWSSYIWHPRTWVGVAADIFVVEYTGQLPAEFSFGLSVNGEWTGFYNTDDNHNRITQSRGRVNFDLRGFGVIDEHSSFTGSIVFFTRSPVNVTRAYLDVAAPLRVTPRMIYVDANNRTAGNGTQANPFRSLDDAVNAASSGDTIVIADGVYHGSFALPAGTEIHPTTIRAAAGANPVITPTIPFNANWRVYRGNIYVADIGNAERLICPQNLQLFVDGVAMVEARYPNLPGPDMTYAMQQQRLTALSGTNSNTLISSGTLPANIADATVVAWPGWQYGAEVSAISSVRGNTINLTQHLADGDGNNLRETNAFYLTGTLSLLDAPGEYYYNARTRRLYFYAPGGVNPNTLNLSLRTAENYALYLNSHTTADGIYVYGGGIYTAGRNITIQNCVIRHAERFLHGKVEYWHMNGIPAIKLSGINITVRNNQIGPTAASGIFLNGTGHTITHNIFNGCNYSGYWFASIIQGDPSTYIEISYNSFYNAGRDHIHYHTSDTPHSGGVVRNNHFVNAMMLTNDGAAFFTMIGSDGGGTEVYHNLVEYDEITHYDTELRLVSGLYADNSAINYTFRNNIIVGATFGFVANLPNENIRMFNNTVMGAQIGFGTGAHLGTPSNATRLLLRDNLFVDIKMNDMVYGDNEGNPWFQMDFDARGRVNMPHMTRDNVTMSGNARGTVDAQFRPTGNTPNVGAIPRNGTMFEYGARIPNVTNLSINASGVYLYNYVNRVRTRGPAIRLGEEVTFIRHMDATWDLVRYQNAEWHVRRNQVVPAAYK
jgi:hypothetical protein